MKQTLLVLRHEVYALVSRRSFWLFLLGVPLFAFIIYGGAAYLNRPPAASALAGEEAPFPAEGSDPQSGTAPTRSPLEAVEEILSPSEDYSPQGYIDQAGLLSDDEWLRYDEREWIRYDDPQAAAEDLRGGKIGAYYIITADYIQSGRLLAYTIEYNLLDTAQDAAPLLDAIRENLFGDPEAADRYAAPFYEVQEIDLTPPDKPQRDAKSLLGLAVPYAATSLLMMSILGSATLLLNGLAEEKVNRTIETLLLSASPREILLGKIAGLGLVGLFQTAAWGGVGFLLLRLSGQTFNVPAAYMLPGSVLAWGVVFFLLGYLLYAALMAGVGALVPGLREASQVTFVVSLPLMIPYFLLPALIDASANGLAVALSIFPLTAPTGMLLRMSAGEVPLWQALLSAGLLALSCLLVIWLAARMFRAQTIMAGQKFNLKNIWKALTG